MKFVAVDGSLASIKESGKESSNLNNKDLYFLLPTLVKQTENFLIGKKKRETCTRMSTKDMPPNKGVIQTKQKRHSNSTQLPSHSKSKKI